MSFRIGVKKTAEACLLPEPPEEEKKRGKGLPHVGLAAK